MPGEELFYLSLSELAKRIESKKLSPVELTQACLGRLHATEATLHWRAFLRLSARF